MYDFQKANMWKRISAWLFDFILIGIVIVGVACLLSLAFRYDSQISRYDECLEELYDKYEEKYGIHLNMPESDKHKQTYEGFTEEEKQAYHSAVEKERENLGKNIEAVPELLALYNEYSNLKSLLFSLALLITTLSIISGFLLMEFIIPLIFKNGQTLGKKIFGIGVMRLDGVKITPLQLFLRSVLGKCTLETLVPVYFILMFIFGIGVPGIICLAVMAALVLSEIVLLFATKARTPIHDIMSGTVTMDFASQMVFDSPEELLAYKQALHSEKVNSQREQGSAAELPSENDKK